MTSTQSMHRRGSRNLHRALPFLLFLLMVGCGQRLEQPSVLAAPYERPQLWAVAPFANESGVTAVDPYRMADLFAQEAQSVQGINVIPVNRVIRAMRELELHNITSPGDARMVMNVLGVDGLIVGSISAYDPYPPIALAAAVELHVQPRLDEANVIDPRSLRRSGQAEISPGTLSAANPVAQAAGVFDAANHTTLAQLRTYARGRSVPQSAYGKDIYLVSMDRYMQFASHLLIHELLATERRRMGAELGQHASR